MKKKLLILIAPLVLLSMFFSAIPAAAADPPSSLPEFFYGTVKLKGTTNAPIGTTIEARTVNATIVKGAFNPITTTEVGKFGSADPLANVPRLLVQGSIPDGTMVTFYVNGVLANEIAYFVSGNVTRIDLTTPPEAPERGGGGGGGSTTVTVTGLQPDVPLVLNGAGQVQNNVVLTDTDRKFNLNIPQLTVMTVGGVPTSTITAAPVNLAAVPPPPSTAAVVLAYDFGPNGLTFKPDITLTMTYDPATLPKGVKPQDLTIAYWDVATGKYIKLQGRVDTVTHSITVLVSHFTTYAIIGDVTADAPSSPSTPTQPTTPAPVTPTAPAPTTPVTPAPGSPAAPAPAPSTPNAPATQQPTVDWKGFALVGMALVVIASLVFAFTRRPKTAASKSDNPKDTTPKKPTLDK